ncbi:hypothetical protein CsSME_00019241 [Camellia sinensis var. sinensis]
MGKCTSGFLASSSCSFIADNVVEDASVNNGQEKRNSKKEQEMKVSPLSTLESSFEPLNAKKFNVAFAVDPLYHHASA